ncbi:nucleotide sugar dehydrogenase [Solidesulfovibrio carbinoliphilus subsp. oakridgensis]|uniref:Nucleotide sugar dehydrogenase n=1 Tax=Solidesulfovibrio carbinoliphilus subsp. oakridgensis TaxID=694327 RepID=G7Q981_9BACT|nr:nucleotide sugar dehydrogenase [Solidesulfovibrio carbinoliphilus]EHJ47803.1 nucleotide sugar dehydrogenase [Solidesulfovibrio carbinoliphilus subsp. oakridgensis]
MITFEEIRAKNAAVAVIGLGYVGLPLAVALAKHFDVVGFDVKAARVAELASGQDSTLEVDPAELAATSLRFTHQAADLAACKIFIVAVPTPINANRVPDLGPLVGASRLLAGHLSPGSIVVYESTVYPGLTEEVCQPLLEKGSGLAAGTDFFLGYSPERINPGDKVHTLATVVKVVAGQTPEVTDLLASLYGAVVTAGIHKAPSIKVAEAAKVIENTQRDINIALMNELSLICERLDIDTIDVLKAAETKWNFLPFRPGLVGGHCIGVDPYYLLYKAQSLNLHPQVIPAGRRINDSMGKHVAEVTIKMLIRSECRASCARIGVLGLTFKENVPDLRNTKVVDIIHELCDFRMHVLVHDPMASPEEARAEYGLTTVPASELRDLDALIVAVGHDAFKGLTLEEIAGWFRPSVQPILIDVKGIYGRLDAEAAGFRYWRL